MWKWKTFVKMRCSCSISYAMSLALQLPPDFKFVTTKTSHNWSLLCVFVLLSLVVDSWLLVISPLIFLVLSYKDIQWLISMTNTLCWVPRANSSFAGDHKIASVQCSVIFAFDGVHTILSMTVFEVLYGYKDLLFVGNWWKAKKFG